MMSSNQSSADSELILTKIKRTKRDAPPSHYILKINSFSKLLEMVTETGKHKYESDEFEAADFKWKLVLYPNGNENGNGEGHISMYVVLTDEKAISSGCHVNALVNLFVHDHIRDKYLTIRDGEVKRFHFSKTQHGFDELLSLAEFTETSNGYLVDDCCAFGAEVHVIKNTVKMNELTVIKDPPNATFTWKIDKFSYLLDECHCSDRFNVGGYIWKLKLYPRGDSNEKDRWMSLCLTLVKGQGVYAEYSILIKDQIHGVHHERRGKNWFRNGGSGWCFNDFKLLSDLRNASNGYLVKDRLIVQAKLMVVSSVEDSSRIQ